MADVAAVVKAGSAVDAEARERATSVYLPSGSVPMLPLEVTAALGMGLHATSPALSFRFRLSKDGDIEDVAVLKTRVLTLPPSLLFLLLLMLLPLLPLLLRTLAMWRRRRTRRRRRRRRMVGVVRGGCRREVVPCEHSAGC